MNLGTDEPGREDPSVSVVVSVLDEASSIERTLDGILMQGGVSYEVVVVDDGSRDEGVGILEQYARKNASIRLLRQNNQGITRSLMEGCRKAKGQYIARHDAGDVSATDRLARQAGILSSNRDVAMVSSWVKYVGPDSEPAGGIRHDPAEADRALEICNEEQKRVRGPYHGSVMFRRSDYEAVGGYRPEFYFAQDVDLWLRLHEIGRHCIIPEELYTARVDPESITGRYRAEQDRCLELAVQAARLRRSGQSEAPCLAEAARIVPRGKGRTPSRDQRARSLYFMGCLLAEESPRSATRYFMKSIKTYPFSPRAWVRFARSLAVSYRRAGSR